MALSSPDGAVQLRPCRAALAAKPLLAAPYTERKNDEDRIGPEAQGGGIGERQQVRVDSFEQVAHAAGQLKSTDPQRPETVRDEGGVSERPEGEDVDNENTYFDR